MHGVGADVHRGAAREVVLVADVGELGQREAQRGLDPPDRAELAAVDDLAHAVRERVVPVVERLHHDEAGARRDRGDVFGLLRVRGERLLAQHVLAGLERGDRPLRVQPVRERVVDRVDVGIGDERRVGVVHLRDAVLRRERVGPAAIARRDRADRRFADVARGLDHGRRRDARRAEDADPNGRPSRRTVRSPSDGRNAVGEGARTHDARCGRSRAVRGHAAPRHVVPRSGSRRRSRAGSPGCRCGAATTRAPAATVSPTPTSARCLDDHGLAIAELDPAWWWLPGAAELAAASPRRARHRGGLRVRRGGAVPHRRGGGCALAQRGRRLRRRLDGRRRGRGVRRAVRPRARARSRSCTSSSCRGRASPTSRRRGRSCARADRPNGGIARRRVALLPQRRRRAAARAACRATACSGSSSTTARPRPRRICSHATLHERLLPGRRRARSRGPARRAARRSARSRRSASRCSPTTLHALGPIEAAKRAGDATRALLACVP